MGDRGTRPRRSRAGVVVLSLVAAGFAGWAVMRSPVFEVRDIRVQGNVRLTAEHISGLAGVEIGENVFAADLGGAESAVEADPWISDATVSRSLPSTVEIRVAERRAAGWVRRGGAWALVSGDGMVLEMVSERPRDLPRLAGLEGDLEPGRAFPDPLDHVRVAGSLDRTLRVLVREAAVDGGGHVELTLRTGERVFYGPAEDLAGKNAALEAMVEWADRRGISVRYFDVRTPYAPALRPAGSEEEVQPPPRG